MSIDEKYKDSFYLGRFFSVRNMLRDNVIGDTEAVALIMSITADYEAGKTPDEIINRVLKVTKEIL
jgi:hypothetical protein